MVGVHGDRVVGSGSDIIAPFTLSGKIRADGTLELIKHYERRHSVLYVGRYDGEGTLSGTWDISGYQGQWSIRFVKPVSGEANEIREIGPGDPLL